jgi:rhodanese-related sulfurtransferase/rubrerythrin
MAGGSKRVKSLFPDELEGYMKERREGTYLLLDVRQPEEYEASHLPGSKLVPLPLLTDSLAVLDREKETVVYCAMGGRSLIAADFLAVRGFKSVYQLQGGIEAWEDRTATGPAGFHLQFIRGDETPEEAAKMAYLMENGLEQFHRAARQKTGNEEVKALLLKLMKAEESHKDRLLRLMQTLGVKDFPPYPAEGGGTGKSQMEGGLDVDEFLRINEHYLESIQGCLELAMMIEVQALDLYLRVADACTHPGAKEVFFGLGDEEKSHLAALGKMLGKAGGA